FRGFVRGPGERRHEDRVEGGPFAADRIDSTEDLAPGGFRDIREGRAHEDPVLRDDAGGRELDPKALEGEANPPRIPGHRGEDRGTDQAVDLVQAPPVRVVME